MNRFQTIIPMSEEELVENHNICDLFYSRLTEAQETGRYEQEVEYNQRLYKLIFERYLRGPEDKKTEEAENLVILSEDSQKIMFQLNHWEETA